MFKIQNYTRNASDQLEAGMRQLSEDELAKVQSVLRDIYEDILFVCRKNGLKVILGGGSALGAVRHEGFIPWDDDIDLIMPREDYNQFITLFNQELSVKYILASPHNTCGKYDYMIRVIKKNTLKTGMFDTSKLFDSGIYIDINALDYVPDNKLVRFIIGAFSNLIFFLINSKMMFLCHSEISDKYFSKNRKFKFYYNFRIFIGAIFNFVSYGKICNIYDSLISYCKFGNLVSIPSGRNHYFGEIQSFNTFFPLKEVYFEEIKSLIPNKYDLYLKKLYGEDYMILPPIEKREPHVCVELKV